MFGASGGADLTHEPVDLRLELGALTRQFVRSTQQVLGSRTSFLGGLGDPGDIFRHVLGALGGFLNVAGNLLGRRTLFLDCRGDRVGDLADLFDRRLDALDRANGVLGH